MPATRAAPLGALALAGGTIGEFVGIYPTNSPIVSSRDSCRV
jgi:hypothetical protein